jgi:high-affinity K+ transport system ATPase subunit B
MNNSVRCFLKAYILVFTLIGPCAVYADYASDAAETRADAAQALKEARQARQEADMHRQREAYERQQKEIQDQMNRVTQNDWNQNQKRMNDGWSR